MKVKMLKDAPGSPDGVKVEQYAKGETYDVTGELGAVFLAHGIAERVERNPQRRTSRKALGGAPENK